MIAVLFSFLLLVLPISAGADEMKLWRVGTGGYDLVSEPHRTFTLQPQPTDSKDKKSGVSSSELRERFGVGLTFGMMQLRWRGELCVSLRKQFDRCDLTIEHDQVLVFARERKGTFPIRIQFGLRP
ncbi:hypothetical protein NBRC116597_41450 [Phaeobacter sp. NW0010-22]